MKKNFVKKLALGLALVMAVTSVPASSEAAAAPGFKSSAVKVRVGQTKKYSTENSKKYSVKFKIGNKKVATIKYTAGSKSVKVTGVAEGKTTLRADFKSYKTKKVTTAKVPVTVLAAKVETPVVVEAALAGVKQTASNAFVATFTADASAKFNKDSFAIAAADSSAVLSVKSVEFAADGLTAVVTTYGNYTDGVTYNVTCADVTTTFVATVGAVTKVTIHTASAQENVKTPIEFTLSDANGIDVTPSVDLNAHCIITIDGTYSGADLDKAAEAYITMNGVGSTADVTVLYNANTATSEDVVHTQTITCVDSKAVLGTKVFATVSDRTVSGLVNRNSGSAKFYLGLSDSVVSVEENDYTDYLYFYAKDAKGAAISYDSYEAESSNDDVASVTVMKDEGKYARLHVNGNSVGTAQINIVATENGKASYYTIPVEVTTKDVAVKMNVSVDRPVMSDVVDSEYMGEIDAELVDKNGDTVAGTFTYELVTETTIGTGLQLSGNVYQAHNAVAKTYTIKVTGADNETGKTFVKNVNVTVKALPDAATTSGSGIRLTYQVELANGNLIDPNPLTTTSNTLSTRLYATYNGLFAGYVRDIDGTTAGGIQVAEGNVVVHNDTLLTDASVVVKYGNLTFDQASDLLGAGGASAESIGTTATEYASVVATGDVFVNEVDNNGQKVYSTIARNGLYTIVYELLYAGETDTVKKTQTFNVKNTMVAPTVKVNTRTAESFNWMDIRECLTTNVDMNNDEAEYISICGLYNCTFNNDYTKYTVKGVIVTDNYFGQDWRFYVPINTTFKAE